MAIGYLRSRGSKSKCHTAWLRIKYKLELPRFSTYNPRQSLVGQRHSTKWGGGRTPHRKNVYLEGETAHTFFIGVTIGVGGGEFNRSRGPHTAKTYTGRVGLTWSAEWVLTRNNAPPWLHLASWNWPDSQLSWESKMKPSVAIKMLCQKISTFFGLHSFIHKITAYKNT